MALTSLWEDAHPTTATVPAEPDVGGEWDVVVVGAGLTGTTTALLLARAGKRVLVVEARHVGAGTTGRSTAKLSVLQGTRLSTVRRRHGERTTRQYLTANQEALAWVERFCGDHGVEVQHRTAVTYAHGSGESRARAELAVARRLGLDVRWEDTLGLPYPTAGGVALDDQLQLDPLALLEALRAQAEAHGASFVEGARVLGVSGRSPVRVRTASGTAAAGRVVVATGMPFLDRGGFWTRMEPERSYSVAFEVPSPSPLDAMYLSVDPPSRSLRDVPGTSERGPLLLVGGEGHVTGRQGSAQVRLDRIRQWTRTHFPQARETHAWSAQDYVPHHQLPCVGPVLPGVEHVLVAGGFAKWGMTNGVAAALALSARILGGQVEWAEALRPWHAGEVTGLPTSARIGAGVALQMGRGWITPVLHPDADRDPAEGEGAVGRRGLRPSAAARDGGQVTRVSGVCTHLGGVVAWNDAERSWDCPLHGSRFDVDGSVLEGVATCGLRPVSK